MDDMFLRESCKSYQKCQVANSARRNSLVKKTIGIEAERKYASHQLDREERQLREQLKHMKMEQAIREWTSEMPQGVLWRTTNTADDSLSGKQENTCKTSEFPGANSESKRVKLQPPPTPEPEVPDVDDCIDPYPVTFGSKSHWDQIDRQRSMTMVEKAGWRYAARRGRRESKEFEDLSLNTATGTLAIPSHLLLQVGSTTSSGSPSPTCPRRKISGASSHSSLDSTEGSSFWPGDPEAIQSVRRPRKSVGQQEKERLMRMKGELTPIYS